MAISSLSTADLTHYFPPLPFFLTPNNTEGSMAVQMKRQKVTTELLEQDENVFVSQNSHQKGLQQYYTPQKLAEFMSGR